MFIELTLHNQQFNCHVINDLLSSFSKLQGTKMSLLKFKKLNRKVLNAKNIFHSNPFISRRFKYLLISNQYYLDYYFCLKDIQVHFPKLNC